MSPLFASALVVHVITGLVGIAAIHFGYMQYIRRTPPLRLVEALVASSVFFLLISWASGALYYVRHYGANVKPRILEGAYPWAHAVFMEAKEHVFILLPFAAFLCFVLIRTERLNGDASMKRATSTLLLVTLALGAAVALSGIIISGAVR